MIKTEKRNGKTYVTSSFFDDLRVLKQSQYDTDYRDLRYSGAFNIEKLKMQYLIQQALLTKKGIIEVSDWVRKQHPKTLENVNTVYPKFITDQKDEDLIEEDIELITNS